jgi:hypothetical protein
VLVDCTDGTRGADHSSPCRLLTQVAVFNIRGEIKFWSALPNSVVALHKATDVSYVGATPLPKRLRFDTYESLFECFDYSDTTSNARCSNNKFFGVLGKSGFNWDSVVVVFSSGGEAISYCDIDLKLSNRLLGDSDAWRIRLYNNTGHARLTPI